MRLLPPPGAADVFKIVGKRGKGKSHYAKRCIAAWMAARRRVLVFDPKNEHSVAGQPSEEVDLGHLRTRISVDGLLACPELLDDPELSLAVVPSSDPELRALQFDRLAKWFVDETTGPKRFIFGVDECYLLHAAGAGPALSLLATQSRHVLMPVVLIAQRATHIPPDARSQATAVAAFRQDHPADLDALADVYGFRGREIAELVGQLEPRQCVVWFDDARQADFPLPLNPQVQPKEKR